MWLMALDLGPQIPGGGCAARFPSISRHIEPAAPYLTGALPARGGRRHRGEPGPALYSAETSLSKSQQLPIFRPPDSHNCSARTASERPRPPSRPRPGGGSDRGTQTRLAIRASGAVRVASMNPVGGPGEDWPRGVNEESSYCSRAARMMEGCEKRRLAGRFARDDDEASPARTAALC